MSTADAFRSSTTRGVTLRRRGDLVVNRQVYQGQAWWVVKDPISLHYFRFRPEEYALLDMLDGVVLVGGADLDPRRDGYMPHPAVRPMDARREDFDRLLAKHICARHMPVLAIGSGMQLLNVTEGGTLFLHIPEDLPKALPHKDPLDQAHRHALVVQPGSVMERVYGDGEIRVNSMHHMAIDDVAESFRVTARAPDGVIEAIESLVEGWVAIGTQFHPEAETASALDVKIFEEFVVGITGEVPAMKLVA